MAFESFEARIDDVSVAESANYAHGHEQLDICACAMCDNGGEDAFGVNGTYNIQYSNVPSTDLSATKQSFTYAEAGAQISRWNAKWDDDGLVGGGVPGNALGTAGHVTYSFLDENSVSADTSTRDYSAMDSAEIARTLMAINEFEEIANITFERLQDTGSEYLSDQSLSEMDFQAIENYNGGWASPNWSSTGVAGDAAALNTSTVSIGVSGLGTYGSWSYKTAIHEIGHAVGLPHPGDYNGSGATTYENQAVYAEDTYMYTVMSYWSHTITGGDTFETVYDDQGNSAWIGGYATGLLLHDIAALHRLYGANMSTRDGDTVYGFNSTEAADSHWNLSDWTDFFVAAIWDGGGNDTIDASGYFEDQVISLVAEDFSSLGGLTYNLSIAQGVVIENAIGGAGNDILIGNAADNNLNGGAGLDIVDYSALAGGITLNLGATVFTAAGAGTDMLTSIEGVIATNGDDTLIGTADDNFFAMLGGNDTITGGGGIDMISLQGASAGVTINANTLTSGTLTIAGLGTNTFTGIEGIEGTEFDDIFYGDGNQQYYNGGRGNDLFVVSAGADQLDGGDGIDTLDLRGSTTRISLTLYTNTVADGGDFGAFTIKDFENVLATNGNDFVNATGGANYIETFDGDDTVYAQGGDDIVRGGAGNDRLYGWYGNDDMNGDDGDDIIEGQFGNDTLRGGAGNDILRGGDGDDKLFGALGEDDLYGGEGNDRIKGQEDNDRLYGEGGNDNISGGAGDDLIEGGAGDDIADGGDGVDTMRGGDGVDRLYGDNGDDFLYGDAGDDRLFGRNNNDTMYGGIGNDFIRGDGGDDMMYGEAGADRLFGGAGNDYASGGADNDRIKGHDGVDELHGGDGNDNISGGAGNDMIYGDAGNDTVDGGTGDDYIEGGLGVDRLFGNEGEDTILGGEGNDFLYGREDNDEIRGGDGRDRVQGDGGNDLLYGDAGDDTIFGGDGNDRAYGGADDDRIIGNNGSDRLYGEDGNDRLSGGADNDFLYGGLGDDFLEGGDGIDRLQGDDGNDQLVGNSGDDILFGGVGDDQLFGDDGNDRLVGSVGFDLLIAGDGDDELNGGDDGDVLIGGLGADMLSGGSGNDIFVFDENDSLVGNTDTITDFAAGDIIAIANHTFIGTTAFTSGGDFEVRYVSNATETYFELDRDGDGTIDERIDLDTNTTWSFQSDGREISVSVPGPGEDGGFL